MPWGTGRCDRRWRDAAASERYLVSAAPNREEPISTVSRIHHSFAGRSVRKVIHIIYYQLNPVGRPESYRLPGGVELQLFPEVKLPGVSQSSGFSKGPNWHWFPLISNPTVIDVGANIGLYSILSEKRMAGTGTIWAFEPYLESSHRDCPALRRIARWTPGSPMTGSTARAKLRIKSVSEI
jgi:hypothetical protein